MISNYARGLGSSGQACERTLPLRETKGRSMTITLNLKSKVEQDLVERAQLRGISVSEYVEEIVTREAGLANKGKASGKQKARAFVEWAENHRHTPPLSDDAISRASLYPDRG